MIKQVLLVALALACAVHAIHLNEVHEAGVDLPAGTVALVADNGENLRVCHGCGGAKPDSASIQAIKDASSVWTLEVVGSQVAFKGSNGLYLSRCNGCWPRGAYPDSAFVHIAGREPYALWTPELQANGKYAFKGDNGKYLARCNGCARSSVSKNFAFVHEPSPASPWAQWDVQYTNLPKTGTATLQADNGGFLKLCQGCGATNAVSVESGSGPNYKWKISRVGTKVVLQASNGNWLSRCNGCWRRGASPDSAFAHLNSNEAPYSQWTAVKQANGKWTFQADTGKFLARCQGCARTSSVPNLAFVHSSNSGNPWAQWTLSYA